MYRCTTILVIVETNREENGKTMARISISVSCQKLCVFKSLDSVSDGNCVDYRLYLLFRKETSD